MRYISALDGDDAFGSLLDRHRGEGPGFGILGLALAVAILWVHVRFLSRLGSAAVATPMLGGLGGGARLR
jgi:hypothetical protein